MTCKELIGIFLHTQTFAIRAEGEEGGIGREGKHSCFDSTTLDRHHNRTVIYNRERTFQC